MKALTVPELIAWKPPVLKWIISDGILYTGTKCIIFGAQETWKSMLCIHTAYTITAGKDWFGFKTTPSKVHIIQMEVVKALYRDRVLKYSTHHDAYPNSVLITSGVDTNHGELKLNTAYGDAELREIVSIIRPQVIIIDPVSNVVSGSLNEAHLVQPMLDNLNRLTNEYGISFILTHHTRKPIITSDGVVDLGVDEMTGTAALRNWADTIIGIHKSSEQENLIQILPLKHRNAEKPLKPFYVIINRLTLDMKVTALESV